MSQDNTASTPSSSTAPKQNWATIFSHEKYMDAVQSKMDEVMNFFREGETAWRRKAVKEAKQEALKEKKTLALMERRNRVQDLEATAAAYAERLAASFTKEDFKCLDNVWLSTFSVSGKHSADDLKDLDALPDRVKHSSGLVLYKAAVNHGFTPRGVISHSRRKTDGGYEYLQTLGDSEGERVYVGKAMAASGLMTDHPLAFDGRKDHRYKQRETSAPSES